MEEHYSYNFYRCVIATEDGHLILDKQGGSQRFRGIVAPTGRGGFNFDGRFYCPYGDCDQKFIGSFAPVVGSQHSEFRGAFVDSPIVVTLRWKALAPGALGGDGYGGVTYGGGGGDDTVDPSDDDGQ
jgi:hypothetical protein